MSDNRKTNIAEVELRWYFGSDAQTAAGDMGLRGIDYGAMAEANAGRIQPDSGAAEARAAKCMDAVRRWRRIHARLRKLSAKHAAALWMAYGQPQIRPGVPALARMSPTAMRVCRAASQVHGREPTWIELDAWLANAPKRALDGVVQEAEYLLRESLMAYARTADRGSEVAA